MLKLDDFDPSKCGKYNPNSNFTACTYHQEAESPNENGFCSRPEFYRCMATPAKIIPLSHSSVQDFLTCHQLYYLKAIRGIQVKDTAKSSPLKMGTLWDKVLQQYLGGKITDDTGEPTTIPKVIEHNEINEYDVAKVKGVYRAYKALEISTEPNGLLQAKIGMSVPFDFVWGDKSPVELLLTGFYDRKYPTYFVENKLSGKPDNYLDPYFIQSQIGTYFLADPTLEYCIMEIVRTPQLKSTGKNKEESADDLQERIYQDAISRPSYYFIGYDSKTHKYGKKYFRAEFNLEELKSRYKHIFREIFDARILDGWYKNDRACNSILPGIPCDMVSICRHGNNFNNATHQIREKKVKF
jgi:hypothetical protein